MSEGEQGWLCEGAGIWGWPRCRLGRFGDFSQYIPALWPLAGDVQAHFSLLLVLLTTFLASPSHFSKHSRVLQNSCLIHLSEQPRSFWRGEKGFPPDLNLKKSFFYRVCSLLCYFSRWLWFCGHSSCCAGWYKSLHREFFSSLSRPQV